MINDSNYQYCYWLSSMHCGRPEKVSSETKFGNRSGSLQEPPRFSSVLEFRFVPVFLFLPPPEDICQGVEVFLVVTTWECCWHLAGEGRGCC